MNRKPQGSIGWKDWRVALAMVLFLLLILCAHYYDIKILEYLAIIPAIYGIVRTFAHAM